MGSRIFGRWAGTPCFYALALLAVGLAGCGGGGGGAPQQVSAYSIGGTVSGLNGTVVLQNNGGNNLSVSANGAFTFSAQVTQGSAYSVTVLTQPAGQTCTVGNGTGTTSVNVTDVQFTCVTNSLTIGGTVSGLSGTVMLQNNGVDDLSVSANGTFTFATPVAHGGGYAVTASSQPAGQNCSIGNGSGLVNGANVTDVTVTCATLPPAAPVLSLGFGIKTFKFSWAAVPNTTHYRLFEDADGVSGFTQVGADIPSGTTSYDHVVALYRRINASYRLQACNSAACTDSAVLSISGNLAQAVGYFKASNTESNDEFGTSIALSADGKTLAVGSYIEDSSATGINGNQSDNAATDSGAVYVFTLSGGVWSQQAYVKASNAEANDLFGISVALSDDGNTLAAGSFFEDSSATGINGNQSDNSAGGSGAVYVFTRSGSTWSQEAYVKASNTEAGDGFGLRVRLSADGDTLAVGATAEDSSATGINGNQSDNSAGGSGAE